jgi:SAM-dependent methyltransferase
MDEIERIRERYSKRANSHYGKSDKYFLSGLYFSSEREIVYAQVIRQFFGKDLSQLKIMEIGAGGGNNLLFFKRFGFSWENIYANELLEERFEILQQQLPNAVCVQGNALELEYVEQFDIVFQSTVFTSILDNDFREKMARKLYDMTKPGGIILSYDFTYNNPTNKDVLKLTKKEIRKLFPENDGIVFKQVSLAPPIARNVGHYYNLINSLFPFLRTHLIAVIKK